jgi:TRAP-type C4-dicarboxylate transport system substrate-binding protein
MKRSVLISMCLVLVLLVSSFITACSEPAPAPAPTPAPAPAPTPAPAPPESVKLIFGTFVPEHDFLANVMKLLGSALEDRSNGAVTMEYSFGGALGPPPEFYDLVVNGVCDIGMVGPSITPGKFPITEVIQNAWIFDSIITSTETYWEFLKKDMFANEFSETIILCTAVGSGDPIYCANKKVTTVADMKGLKLRTTGGQQTMRLEALGAVPVNVAVTEVYQALQKGTIDATITNWGGVKTWKLDEVTKYATVPGAGATAVVFVMNKGSYNKLPDAAKAVIDDMIKTGEFTTIGGQKQQEAVDDGRDYFVAQGGEIVEWTPEAIAEMDTLWAPIWDEWLDSMDEKGLPGKETVDEMYAYLQNKGISKPAIGYTP